MQPETKIGLALGMILLGFFLAIGVRLTAEPAAPELRHPEIIEAAMTRNPLPLAPIAPLNAGSVTTPNVDFAKSSLVYQGDEFAPNPIKTNATATASQLAGKSPSGSASATKSPPVDMPSEVVMHTVGEGETLSSIASKRLGSSARYQEIFELNRDQLSSPDNLQVGMQLIIRPAVSIAQTPANVPTPASKGSVESEPKLEASQVERIVKVDEMEKKLGSGGKRFSPARQSPFASQPMSP